MIEKLHNEIIENLGTCYSVPMLKMINRMLKDYNIEREKTINKPYTVKEVAEELELSTDDVMELIDNGTLKADKDNCIAADEFRTYRDKHFGYEA